jgi:hypothetical protein
VLIRCWRYHTRPGRPTIPYRCDVHVKCAECGMGWWHGVALPEWAWRARPLVGGWRGWLCDHGLTGSFEPAIWNGNRDGRSQEW